MYSLSMMKIASSEARSHFAQTLDHAAIEPLIIERRGQNDVVVMSSQLFEQLIADSEEMEDIRLFDESMAEEGENIPWDQVLEDLGWD